MAQIRALDENGLLYLWQKIVARFVAKENDKGLSTNDYTTAEKQKLASLENYTLPDATTNTKGGIKVGTGLEMDANGKLNVTSAGSVDWTGITNKPVEYTPSVHTHAVADVTGLSAALDAKAASNHTHTASEIGAAEEDHTHTANDVGAIPATQKGANNGVATLDANGRIPSSQIPGAFDDIVDGYYDEAQNKFYADSAKTTELEKVVGRFYVDLTLENGTPAMAQYRWGGTVFSPTAVYVTAMTNSQIDTQIAAAES